MVQNCDSKGKLIWGSLFVNWCQRLLSKVLNRMGKQFIATFSDVNFIFASGWFKLLSSVLILKHKNTPFLLSIKKLFFHQISPFNWFYDVQWPHSKTRCHIPVKLCFFIIEVCHQLSRKGDLLRAQYQWFPCKKKSQKKDRQGINNRR